MTLNLWEASMLQLLLKTASKSCNLDRIPTPLTKQYLDVLVPVITNIINTSLTTGIDPDCFKSAVVNPLLKEPGLDVNDLKKILGLSVIFHFSLKFLKQLSWHNLNPTCLETTSVKFASQHIGKITVLRHFCLALQTVFFARLTIDSSRYWLYCIKVPLLTQLITKFCSTGYHTHLVSVALCSNGSYHILPTKHSLWET